MSEPRAKDDGDISMSKEEYAGSPSSIPLDGTVLPPPPLASLLKRGLLSLEHSEWGRASEFFDRVLDRDPECAQAYIGMLCADIHVQSEERLGDGESPISEHKHFQNAVRFADAKYRTTLQEYNQRIRERILQKQYDQLVERKYRAFAEKEYQELAKKLREIDWKDSTKMAKECDEEYRTLRDRREKLDWQRRHAMKLVRHTGGVYFATFSPNGLKVVTASADRTARIWDAESGKELRKLEGHTGLVRSAVFSLDGSKIITASEDKTVRIWDAESGQSLHFGPPHAGSPAKIDHADYVSSAVFSSDCQKIVMASDDGTAIIFEVEAVTKRQTLKGHAGAVCFATFSPDGQKVITASVDGTARIWDAESGKELQKLGEHADAVWSGFFSPDGTKIVTASSDYTARIWAADDGKEMQKLEGHTNIVCWAVFSPDGKRIGTASWDNTFRIWDAESGRGLQILEGHTSYVFSGSSDKCVPCPVDGENF